MQNIVTEIKNFLQERNWHKPRPSDLAKSIVIEAAELLELFQSVDLNIEQTQKDKKLMEKIKEELADVLVYCLQMAGVLGLDPEKIVKIKMAHNSKKFPTKMVKKQTPAASHRAYLLVKKRYRKTSPLKAREFFEKDYKRV